MNTENIVTTIMTEALMKASNPEAYALITAERLTTDRMKPALPRGAKRRLTQEQATAAATAITRILRRLDLSASDVCAKARIEDPQTRAFVFTLTRKEMNERGELTGELPGTRRFHKSVDAYARMARAAAHIAGVDPTVILQEVAVEIADYLAPFVESDPDIYEELTSLLAMLGPFFNKTRKGTGGEPVDLGEFLSFTAREGVIYHPDRQEIIAAPEEPYPGAEFEQAPTVPLFVRTVASGVAEARRHSPAPEDAEVATVAVSLGAMQVKIIEVISLGITRDRSGMRAVFFAEPWTVTYGRPGDATKTFWAANPSRFVQGTPFSGGLRVTDGEDSFELTLVEEPQFHCRLYEGHVRETLADAWSREGDFEHWYCLEVVNVARRVEIEPEVLRTWLETTRDEHWRVPLGFAAKKPSWAQRFALPASLTLTDGRDAPSILDRLKHALLGSDRAIVEGLLAEVTSRVQAMDAFIAKNETEEYMQKARFRRLMHS